MRELLEEAFGYKVGDPVLIKFGVWPLKESSIESICGDGDHIDFFYTNDDTRNTPRTLFDSRGNILAGHDLFHNKDDYEAKCLRITKILKATDYISRCSDVQLDALLEYCKAN